MEGVAEAVDRFGTSLAAEDFNADGFADLAIGVPHEDTVASGDGGVSVIYGSVGGLSATVIPDQLLGQDSPNVEGNAEAGDEFGSVLTAGDFNGDGRSDLAIGVPLEDAGGVDDGGVGVIYGAVGGLSATATPDQFLGRTAPAWRAPRNPPTSSAPRSRPHSARVPIGSGPVWGAALGKARKSVPFPLAEG